MFYYNVLPVKTAEAPVLNEYVVIAAVIQKPNVCVCSVAVPHRLFLPGIVCTSCLQSKIMKTPSRIIIAVFTSLSR